LDALTVRTTRNFADEAVKECRADSRSGSIAHTEAMRDAISAISAIGTLSWSVVVNLQLNGVLRG
jgi:hypothetical protein